MTTKNRKITSRNINIPVPITSNPAKVDIYKARRDLHKGLDAQDMVPVRTKDNKGRVQKGTIHRSLLSGGDKH